MQALPHVLVVDTNEADALILGCYLQALDCVYDIAADRRTAITLIEEQTYGVIFISLEMRPFDGFELAALIRRRERERVRPRAHIVAMTASRFANGRPNLIEYGIDGFMIKPCNAEWLAQCFRDAGFSGDA